jgi:hypothetical protein
LRQGTNIIPDGRSPKIGGREGFIPAPGGLVSKGLFELSEYPYLWKYLVRKAEFGDLDREI